MLQNVTRGLFLAFFLLPIGCSNETEPTNINISADSSGKAEGAAFELLDKTAVNILSDSRLQLINYWATWCLPCLEEMPELAAFREEHKESVEVYAVNYDGLDIDQLRQEIATLDVEIPALVKDPNKRLGYERPSVLPTTVVMRDGQVKEVLVGPQTKETLEAVLHKWGT